MPALDPLETRLLQFIALSNDLGARLSVRDLIYHQEFGSAPMLHKRLQRMRQKGWLKLLDTEDTRRKQLALTEPAVAFLGSMAECMTAALH